MNALQSNPLISRPLLVCLAVLISACSEERPAESPRLTELTCPSRMVKLSGPEGTFCIDRHEAQLDRVHGRAMAEPAAGKVPTLRVSQIDAEAGCSQAGHRLCTEVEWQFACDGGSEQREHSYEGALVEGRCNTHKLGDPPGELWASGSHPECVTPDGVFDLAGNVAEWTSTTPDEGKTFALMGGGYGSPTLRSGCLPKGRILQPPEADFAGHGFRCCADAAGPSASN